MFPERQIEFGIHKDLINIEIIQPKETKKILPNWYKNIEKNSLAFRNIKGCIPFLDNISAGYVLPLPQDLYISHNIKNEDTGKIDSFYQFSFADGLKEELCDLYNMNGSKQTAHNLAQVGGADSFLGKKNGNNHIIKILNPWYIKTPPGYSCLFTSLTFNENDYFSAIPAIVDTDVYEDIINFPIIINHEKYFSFKKFFKQGLPYVQIIPFKRDSWKKKITIKQENRSEKFKFFSIAIDRYKQLVWNKKSWR